LIAGVRDRASLGAGLSFWGGAHRGARCPHRPAQLRQIADVLCPYGAAERRFPSAIQHGPCLRRARSASIGRDHHHGHPLRRATLAPGRMARPHRIRGGEAGECACHGDQVLPDRSRTSRIPRLYRRSTGGPADRGARDAHRRLDSHRGASQ